MSFIQLKAIGVDESTELRVCCEDEYVATAKRPAKLVANLRTPLPEYAGLQLGSEVLDEDVLIPALLHLDEFQVMATARNCHCWRHCIRAPWHKGYRTPSIAAE